MAQEFIARNGLIAQNNSTVTGSLTVTQGITGSLLGTSSYSVNGLSSSLAQTASFAPNYQLISGTGSMLQPYVLTSTTSSMSVATASFTLTASLAPNYLPLAGGTLTGDLTVNGSGNRVVTVSAGSAGGTEIRLLPNSTGGYVKINVGNTNAPLEFQMNSATVMTLTQAGNLSIASQTGSTIASFDASKNIVSLPTTTYPSLTELTYVRGVTSSIQPQIDATTVNVITITTGANNIDTNTTGSSGYGQHGRHTKISNAANAINLTVQTSSNADFVASYDKIGTGTITFTQGTGATLTSLSGTSALTGSAGSKACLSRNGNTFYLQITNY